MQAFARNAHISEAVATPSSRSALCPPSTSYTVKSGRHSTQQPSSHVTAARSQGQKLWKSALHVATAVARGSAAGLEQPAATADLPSAQADEDSRKFAIAAALVADETKCTDVVCLHVAPLISWTSYMVIATVMSKPQVRKAVFSSALDPCLLLLSLVLSSLHLPPINGRLRVTATPVASKELRLPESKKPDVYLSGVHRVVQLLAVMARVERMAQEQFGRVRSNLPGSSPWEVLDFGDVVVQVRPRRTCTWVTGWLDACEGGRGGGEKNAWG